MMAEGPIDPVPGDGSTGGRRTGHCRVVPGPQTDDGRAIARLDLGTMENLALSAGDIVRIGTDRQILARAMPAPSPRGGSPAIGLGPRQRSAAAVDLDETVLVVPQPVEPADLIRLDPVTPGQPLPRPADQIVDALCDQPVSVAQLVSVFGTEFRIAAIEPEGAAKIVPSTRLVLEDGAAGGTADGQLGGQGFPGIGGLQSQIAKLREMVSLPLSRPDVFRHLGIEPPRGVLFTGPPGSGKTLLARAVAQETEANFFQINGPEIVSKHYGDSESKLREVFSNAAKSQPAIIFIDEIDAIAPRRDALSGEKQLERRVVAQLLTLMDGLSSRGQVIVMAATNLPNMLDPALRRPGRFDREIAFHAPDTQARKSILQVHLDGMPVAPDVDLDDLADATSGFVGADLAALAQEAALAALARAQSSCRTVDELHAPDLQVVSADFLSALSQVSPSVLRGARVETTEARWSDIGGSADVKSALAEAVIWPIRYDKAFRTLNLPAASGVLLAGPPGTGKTLIARALATESGVNFVAVRGAGLLSQYLGEAERAVAETFDRARQAAPCILFFDEIDAIAPVRGTSDSAMERVVAELLVEIDGMAQRHDVFLLGATNRVSAIDPALLRPGRFDVTIPMGLPDTQARRDILAVHTHQVPLAGDVDLNGLAIRTEGSTGADLAALCQTAARQALRRSIETAGDAELDPDAISLTAEDFEIAAHLRQRSDAARSVPGQGAS